MVEAKSPNNLYNFIKYNQVMSQTPFQSLQRKDRERRISLKSNIEKKDLKHRSISYSFKKTESQQDHCPESECRSSSKQQINRITFNNSLKKSYFYRKLLNKSVDGHFTSEQFQRMKEKFDRINIQEHTNDNKSTLFRQIWEQEHQRKYSIGGHNEDETGLQIVSKNKDQRQLTHELPLQTKKSGEQRKKKIEDISDIAAERKTSLNFDLQIMGNKKSIRIKQGGMTRGVTRKNNQKFNTIAHGQMKPQFQSFEQINPQINVTLDEGKDQNQMDDSVKKCCSFFKRFQQENRGYAGAQQENSYLKISKFNTNIMAFTNTRLMSNDLLQKIQHKDEDRISFPLTSHYNRRQVKSSWSPSTPLQNTRKYLKVQTADEKRSHLRRGKHSPAIFTNDIKGWMVGQQHEEDLAGVFGG